MWFGEPIGLKGLGPQGGEFLWGNSLFLRKKVGLISWLGSPYFFGSIILGKFSIGDGFWGSFGGGIIFLGINSL